MLLFGAYAYTCRLPFAMSSGAGLEYSQTLGENYPEFQDHVPIPQSLDWDKRPGLGEKDAWERPVRARLERIALAGQEAATRARCRRAWGETLTKIPQTLAISGSVIEVALPSRFFRPPKSSRS